MYFSKIIYFDESSVADFMQIVAGGEMKKTTEFITDVSAEVGGDFKAKIESNNSKLGITKLFSFLSGVDVTGAVEVSAGAGYKRDKLVKNIIENTLLADFIDLMKNDQKRKDENKRCKNICIFKNISIYPEHNSFTFLMLAAPYFSLMEGKVPVSSIGMDFEIDISKMEGALEKGRGYYEFIGKQDGHEVILRFNISAFRNNYTMSDLPKMRLTYYAFKVGEITKNKLDVNKEFEFGAKHSERIDFNETENTDDNESLIEVFDVVLAGV